MLQDTTFALKRWDDGVANTYYSIRSSRVRFPIWGHMYFVRTILVSSAVRPLIFIECSVNVGSASPGRIIVPVIDELLQAGLTLLDIEKDQPLLFCSDD